MPDCEEAVEILESLYNKKFHTCTTREIIDVCMPYHIFVGEIPNIVNATMRYSSFYNLCNDFEKGYIRIKNHKIIYTKKASIGSLYKAPWRCFVVLMVNGVFTIEDLVNHRITEKTAYAVRMIYTEYGDQLRHDLFGGI